MWFVLMTYVAPLTTCTLWDFSWWPEQWWIGLRRRLLFLRCFSRGMKVCSEPVIAWQTEKRRDRGRDPRRRRSVARDGCWCSVEMLPAVDCERFVVLMILESTDHWLPWSLGSHVHRWYRLPRLCSTRTRHMCWWRNLSVTGEILLLFG
jgi:hypothetical protein